MAVSRTKTIIKGDGDYLTVNYDTNYISRLKLEGLYVMYTLILFSFFFFIQLRIMIMFIGCEILSECNNLFIYLFLYVSESCPCVKRRQRTRQKKRNTQLKIVLNILSIHLPVYRGHRGKIKDHDSVFHFWFIGASESCPFITNNGIERRRRRRKRKTCPS